MRDSQTQPDIVAVARAEAAQMRGAMGDAPDSGEVRFSIAQFRHLATTIEALCDMAEETRAGSMTDTRYWVPLDHFQRVRAQASEWQAECGRLNERQAMTDMLRF